MSNKNLESAISTLQESSNSKEIFKALISIRKEVDWPKNRHNVVRLRERGCLKQITRLLTTSANKSCVDLALSILGNCLMDRTCTREVVTQHQIMSALHQLLKKNPKEDSINGRTFRIVGNICQHRDQWATVLIDKKPMVIMHIVDIVKKACKDEIPEAEKISEATVITALRALRELLNSNTIMSLVKKFGTLKAIGALFIKYSKEWQENRKNEKMVLDIIRVIQEYSRFRYYHSILEMRTTEKGDSLIHLSSVLILAPKRIVKIVMNFIRSCQLKSELPVPEICSKFVDILETHSILKELDSCSIEYLQCLCYLLDHPANRNEERCGKVIPLLINVLKEVKEPSAKAVQCCILLIHALNKFKYADRLMLDQIKHDIIPALISKLTWLVGPPSHLNFKHASENKRKYIFGSSGPTLRKRKLLVNDVLIECGGSPSSSDDEFDLFSRIGTLSPTRSPSPCSSSDGESVNAVTWSDPGSSPNRSLVHESDSDNYSPVCSEADDTEFQNSHDQAEHDYFDQLPPATNIDGAFEKDIDSDTDEKCSFDLKKNIPANLKVELTQAILKLIKSYVKLKVPCLQLASEDLLVQLSKCTINELYDVKDVVCDIVKFHEYLIPLMKTNFIQTLYEMRVIPPNHDCCSKCLTHSHFTYSVLKVFTEMAESGAGKGDIAHKLLKADVDTKRKLVLTIPYIISNRSILGKLMLNCGGLDVLMNLIQEDDKEDNECSVKVLCKMASSLLIANPRSSSSDPPKITADKYKLSESCDKVVSFVFDDGHIVKADRDFLIGKSDFFSGLLNGHFRESEQNEITMTNVESKTFRCMLHLLKCVKNTHQVVEIEDLDLENLLDVILLCDRYLLIDLCVVLTSSVEQRKISTETVPLIYNWSIVSGTNLLRVESVAYALVGKMDDKQRLTMFDSLFDLGYRDELVEDIKKLLMRYLALSDYHSRELEYKRNNLKGKMRDRLLK